MKKGQKVILLFLLVIIADFAFGQGCSQCKALAEQGAEAGEGSFGSNINGGILMLMTVPYILLFILFHKRIFAFFRELRGK